MPLTLAGRASESSTITLGGEAPRPLAANAAFLAVVPGTADITFSGGLTLVAAPRHLAAPHWPPASESVLSTEPDQTVDVLITQAECLVGRTLPPAVARACEAGLLALLMVAGTEGDGPQPSPPEGDQLYRDVLADIAANCRQHDYGVAQVAQRHKLNVRTLQKMFQRHGSTLKAHITTVRLKFAAAALLDPAHAGKKVSDVAFEAGFNDIATFNRLFRKTFGRAPSAFRAEAAKAASGATATATRAEAVLSPRE